MISNLWDDERMSENFRILSNISVPIIIQNVLVVVIVSGICVALMKVSPLFKYSLFSLFSRKDPVTNELKSYEGININIIPATVKYFGLVFLVLFAINLPRYAQMEEEWFREGVVSWEQGLLMSLLFGLTHCLAGVPIGAGLAISIAGLWFTHQYFIGGVALSAVHHTAYNLILVLILFVILGLKHILESASDQT